MMEDTEKRRGVRVSFRTETTIYYLEKQLHLGGDTANLSMSGMLAETHEEIPLGTACQVRLRLAGTQEPIELTMTGRVVRHDPAGIGIHFEEMDLDSYTLLKEVVRYNAKDPDLV